MVGVRRCHRSGGLRQLRRASRTSSNSPNSASASRTRSFWCEMAATIAASRSTSPNSAVPKACSSIPTPPTTAPTAAAPIPMAHFGPTPRRSSAPCSSCPSIPATRPHPASRRCPDFPPPTASPSTSCRTTCPASRSRLYPQPTRPPSFVRSVAPPHRATGRAACPSPIASAATTPRPSASTCASPRTSELRTIWDVIGKIPGSADPSQWVVAGNHRDAWVYGAGDPGSGTAAMLEAVHGLGVLLQHGWKPRRTIVVASWDAEEEGLIGSTEWVEQNEELHHAVAYFNMDVAVSGPVFTAAAVPSLREFVQQIAKEVPSPAGGTVYQQWKRGEDPARRRPSRFHLNRKRQRPPCWHTGLRFGLHPVSSARRRARHRHRFRRPLRRLSHRLR